MMAAFMASYNPVKFDARFFGKRTGSKRKGGATAIQQSKRDTRFSGLQTGPKPFDLSRMLAIYRQIVDADDDRSSAMSIDVYTQVATLVSLHMLTKCSTNADKSMESMRLKINVSLEYILHVAASVQFDLTKYLYEYNR